MLVEHCPAASRRIQGNPVELVESRRHVPM